MNTKNNLSNDKLPVNEENSDNSLRPEMEINESSVELPQPEASSDDESVVEPKIVHSLAGEEVSTELLTEEVAEIPLKQL